jgi:thiol-disulfide isomerase/thioredoxin
LTTPRQIDRPARKASNWISSALVFALVVAAVVMAFLESSDGKAGGGPAPEFSFERFTGGQVTSAELKGRVVMLDFWATWCPPCVEEMPMLVRVAKEYEAKGVTFVAVSHDDPEGREDAVAMFVNHREPGLKPFAAYGDPQTGAKYQVRALPTIYIIDRNGKIVASQTGQVSERKIRSWLDKALLVSQ